VTDGVFQINNYTNIGCIQHSKTIFLDILLHISNLDTDCIIEERNMNKLTVFTFLLLAVALLQAQPVWFTRPAALYNPADYITGVGEGNTHEEAYKNAILSIEQQLSILVKPSDNVEDGDPAQETAPYLAAYIYENSHKISDQQINKLEIRQRQQVGDTNYVLVVLLKHNVLSTIQRDINNLWARLQKDLQTAEQQKNDLQYINAIETYAKAQQVLFELCMRKLFHDNLATRPYLVDNALSETLVEAQVKDLISSVNFEVVSGNQQTTHKGTLLPQPITFYACAKKNGKNVTLGKLPVSINYDNGSLIETGLTKPDGTYQVYAAGIPSSGDRGKITIQIDPHKFPGFFNRILRNKSVSAHFQTTETSALQASLTVIDLLGKPIAGVQPHIVNFLGTYNIRQSDRAPVYIRATADIFNKKTITDKWVVRNEVFVTIDLEIGIIITNEMLGTIRCTGEGVSERNEQEAINLAFMNININQREIAYMVEKAQRAITSFNQIVSNENLNRGKTLYVNGQYNEAIDTLLKVNVGEENITEAVTLLNIIKAYVRK